VSVLLAAGASTEVCRVNGCTPLLEAAANGNDECVRKLLQGGADLAAKDNDGKDAFALGAASPIGADAVLAVLREFSEAAAGVDGASATGEATAAQADRLAKLADEGTGGGDSGEVTDAGA
jgi:ankyrin repeat protein